MAKVKNKRNAGAADRASQKRKAEANKKKLNPFEVHINREKHHVLGKKSKHDRGLPGVSRAKAIKKRKETLGTEMKLMHKTNTFIDKRIGEKDNGLSAEEQMVARFAAERAKQHGRKNIYNLADDEMLTHRGQTLEQIEKFDDPRSDEEDEADFRGLDNDFVSEGHFGGGVLAKSDKDGAKSHKDLIEQLIAESKKRKAEKQMEKEQTLDLTEKLDSEWKDLQPVVFKRARVEEESAIDKVLGKAEKNSQDYDKMMRELRFEKRGTPSDAIKTDEKLEKEQQLRIAQLEKERDLRMLGDYEAAKAQPTTKHRSADDLEDNFELDDEQDFMLAYDKDGKPLVPDHILKANSVPKSNKKEFDDGLTESSADEEDEEAENKSENDDTEESEKDDEIDEEEVKNNKVDSKSKDKPANKLGKSILFQDSEDDEDVSNEDSDNKKKPVQKSSVENKSVKQKAKEVEPQETSKEISDESESSDSDKKSKSNKKRNESETNSSKVIDSLVTAEENGELNEKSKKTGTKVTKNSKVTETESESKDDTDDEYDNEEGSAESSKVTKTDNKEKASLSQYSTSENDSSDQDESKTGKLKKKSKKLLKLSKSKKVIGDSDDEMSRGEESEDDDEYLKSFLGKTTEYENLRQLLSGKSPSQQSTALQKLIKSYDPSLGENNKELLSKLFANMLQYVNDLFTNLKNDGEMMKSFLILDKIEPYFFNIALMNKVSSRKFFAELLTEKHEEYKKKPKRVPDFDTLIFFKLIAVLYPTSDFRHPITTPSLTFMSQILTTCKFRDAYSISRGMFVTTLILEYTALSKRYVPAAVNFIRGILYLSAKTTVLNPIQVVPPFRLHKDEKILILEDDCSKLDTGWRMTRKDLITDSIDNEFKIRTVLNATLMLRTFFDNCNEMEAQECIFEPHVRLLNRLELELYPKKVASAIEEIIKYMKGSLEVKTYTPLSREKPKPKALRLYEPDIQEVFTGSKSSKLSRELAERQRLEHRYKREMKGALREIRRDKAYVASVKIRDKIYSDKIRKDKVKQIYKDASIQQGELNKLKRGK